MTSEKFKKNKIIKARMKELGITQHQLADQMTNITRSNLQYHLNYVDFDNWHYSKATEVLRLLKLNNELKKIEP